MPQTSYFARYASIGQVFRDQAATAAESVALVAPDRNPLTFGDLARHAELVRKKLNDWGLGRGDRVALVVPSRPEMAVAYLTVVDCATVAPLNPALTTREFEDAFRDLKTTAVITEGPRESPVSSAAIRVGIPVIHLMPDASAPAGLFRLVGSRQSAAAAAPGPAQPDDVALVHHTSGTTGRPKIVPIRHATVVERVMSRGRLHGLRADDRCLHVMPLFLNHGLDTGLLAPLAAGGSVVILPGFDPSHFYRALDEFRPTWYSCAPVFHEAVLEAAPRHRGIIDCCRLRFIRSATYRLSSRLLSNLEQTFGAPVIEHYGCTEAGTITCNFRPPGMRKPGTVGVPFENEVAVIDEAGRILPAAEVGEIIVRGPSVFEGYEGDSVDNSGVFINGWFRTGDLGAFGEDGFLTIVGRVRDRINRGGQKLSPQEVEDVLRRHSDVLDAACFGVSHPTLGDEVAAVVVLRKGALVTEADLRRLSREHLAEYKVPRRITRVDAIPKGSTGKVERFRLAAVYGRIETTQNEPHALVEPNREASSVEAALAELWAHILKLESVPRDDNFFLLGGDSLRAIQLLAKVREQFGADLPIQIIFDQGATLAGMAAAIETVRNRQESTATGSNRDVPIERRKSSDPSPLSFSQHRLWISSQLDPDSRNYNLGGAMRITGILNVDGLRKAIGTIVDRHESLRTNFAVVDGEPRQIVARARSLLMPVIDLSGLPADERWEKAKVIAIEESRRSYDLAKDALIRVMIVRLDEQEHVLVTPKHHIIFDGMSERIFNREMAELYQAFAHNKPCPIGAPAIQYADYSIWQSKQLAGDHSQRELAYLRQRLEGAPPVLALPTDYPRPPQQSFRGSRQWFELSTPLTEALKSLSRREGVTLFHVLMAAFNTLLHRYAGLEDLVVGTFVNQRHRPELEGLIGFCLNTLVMRTDLSGDPSFRQLVARVRDVARDALAHQMIPFEQLVEALHPKRNPAYSPIVQVAFGVMPEDLRTIKLPGLTFERIDLDLGISRFDLSVVVSEESGHIEGFAEYRTDLFQHSTIARMMENFRVLLEAVVANSDQPVSELPVLTPTERQQVLESWNDTTRAYPQSCVHQLFEEQARNSPQSIAVVLGDQQLTYGELNHRANQLAHHLQSLGVGPETLVALCLERSLEMMVGLLAILKAGGAYVWLDPEYPPFRLALLLEDTAASVLVTQQSLISVLPDSHRSQVFRVDRDWDLVATLPRDDLPCHTTLDNLAYVSYTSGSTGQPKGVEIPHRGVVRLLFGCDYARLDATQTILQASPVSFDASTFEIWGALLHGGRCVLLPQRLPTASELERVINAQRVNTLWLTASLFNVVIDERPESLRGVRQLLIGGEALSIDHVRRAQQALPETQIINGYGPTEGTTFTCCYRIPCFLDANMTSIPLGRPIGNTRTFVLDRHLQPVPIGVAGELCIGGDGLARGYWKRPDLTREKFISHPFHEDSDSRLYRSGDRVRYLADGLLEFLGRLDDQVKIRGHRIEPGEIESVLARNPQVRQAVVVAREDVRGENRLVAYVVPAEEQPFSAADVEDYVRRQLPEYLVPSVIVRRDAIPLNSSGKVDRRALPAPEVGNADAGPGHVAPRSAVEEKLAAIWRELLHRDRVGIHENFFDLGGHSLMATRVVARIGNAFHVELPIRMLFESPTVAGLASVVEQQMSSKPASQSISPRHASREEPSPLSFAQERLWFLDQLEPNSSVYNVPQASRISGPLSMCALRSSLNEIVRRHRTLRTSFQVLDGQPVQSLVPETSLDLPLVDLSHLSDEKRESELGREIQREIQRPFDLCRDVMLRACLIRLSDQEHVLVLTMHHIAFDGWSFGVFCREFSELYRSFTGGLAAQLDELPIQYADYAVWQREWLDGHVLDRHLEYWKRSLQGAPAVIELPTDRPYPAVRTHHGARHLFRFSQHLSAAVYELSRREGTTAFMSLLAAWNVLLAQLSGQQDIVVGTPVAGRNRLEVENLIGFFVNTLALRTDLSGRPTFRELLGRVRDVTLEAFEHQELPFEKLVEELQPVRDPSRSPIFQVMFVLQNTPQHNFELPGLSVTRLAVDSQIAKFDLTLSMHEDAAGLYGTLQYNTDLFLPETISRMMRRFQTLLEQIVSCPDQPVSQASVLSPTERQPVLRSWNDTAREHPLTASRKVDRGALPVPDSGHTGRRTGYVAPRRPVERQLAAIWCELLRLDRVGVYDNFFDLGGHSLLAVKMFNRLEAAFGKRLPLATLFQGADIRHLADALGESVQRDAIATVVDIRPQEGKTPLFFLPSIGGELMFCREIVGYLSPDQPVYGIQPIFFPQRIERYADFESMVAQFVDVLCQFWPEGPCCLVGYSYGGFVAYEMARQLQAKGRHVRLLAIIDTGFAEPRRSRWHRSVRVWNILRNLPFWIKDDFVHTHPSEMYLRLRRWKRRLEIRRTNFRHSDATSEYIFADAFGFHDMPVLNRSLMNTIYNALRKYSAKPYPGRLVLLRARTRPLWRSFDIDLGWGAFVKGGVDVRHVPGHHESMLHEPHVRVLAEHLSASLELAESEWSFPGRMDIPSITSN